MTNILSHFKRKYDIYALSALSGILFGTSYIPYPAWAIFFCFIPLWYAIIQAEKQSLSLKEQFFMGWVCQFIFTLIGFNWIAYTASEFGHFPGWLSYLTLFIFAALMHVFIPLSIISATFLKRQFNLGRCAHIFLIAIISSLTIRFWPTLFSWNLGYTLLWMKWPIYQWADTIGFSGLSTLILLVQALILIGLLEWKNRKVLTVLYLVIPTLLLTLLNITGLQKEKKWSTTNQNVRFSVTQGNIGNEEKLFSELGKKFQAAVVNKYFSQADEYLAEQIRQDPQFYTDIILWPETAMPLALDPHLASNPLQAQIQAKAKAWNAVLVTGAFSHDPVKKDFLGYLLTRNAIFFLGPNGPQQPAYYKTQLLAFGEYLPFGENFPFLYKLVPFVGTYERGPGPVAKKVFLANQKTVTLGPQICYESLDPEFSRGLARKGTDIIFNVTNDSWFGDWAEPYQHMTMTLARAIEVRRPLVRATNTGISAAILANGEILEQSRIDQRWMSTYDVKYLMNAPLTDYTLWGHFDWLLLFGGLIFIIVRAVRKEKNL